MRKKFVKKKLDIYIVHFYVQRSYSLYLWESFVRCLG